MRDIGINQTFIEEVDVLIAVMTGSLSLVGTLANGIVLLAIAGQRFLHRGANALLFSLGLIDLFACAISGPYSIITFYFEEPWPSFSICQSMFVYGVASSTTSCIFISLISINGVMNVIWSNKIFYRKNCLVVVLTIFGWVASVIIYVLTRLFIKGIQFQALLGVCYLDDKKETMNFTIFVFTVTAMTWIISIVCYLKILNIVRISARRVAEVANIPKVHPGRRDVRNKRLLQLVLTVFISLIVYTFMFLPLLITEMIYRVGYHPHYLLYRLVCMLLWSSSVVNPFIYAYRLHDIKKGVTNIFNKIRCFGL